jgi:hypothetical protein
MNEKYPLGNPLWIILITLGIVSEIFIWSFVLMRCCK